MKGWAIRASAFILLLVLGQFLVSRLLPAEIPPEIQRLEQHLANGVDVLYFGDSTLSLPAGQVTTGQILQELLPRQTIGEISHPAYNLDLYLHYVRYIARSAHRPQIVIIPINMRSFSPEWDQRPGYQFEEVKKTLDLGLFFSRILSRPLAMLGVFEPSISQETFLNTVVYNGDTPTGTVRDFEGLTDEGGFVGLQGDTGFIYHDALPPITDTEALRQALIYRYMQGLKTDHRQLQAMEKIAELGQQSGIQVIFYITPVNHQQGQRFLGETFLTTLEQNVSLVQSLADRLDATLLDCSLDLEAYAFVDMEHMREVGKAHVAERLVRSIEPEWSIASLDDDVQARSTVLAHEPSATATSTATRRAPTTTVTRTPTSTILTGVARTPSTAALTAARTAVSTATRRAPTTTVTWTPVPSTFTVTRVPDTSTPRPSPSAPPPTQTATPLATATTGVTATPTQRPPDSGAQKGTVGGTVVEVEYGGRFSPVGEYAVDLYHLRYQTLDENGQTAETRADLFVPYVETATTFPILVHAVGTTGISNECAPVDEETKQQHWGSYREYSLPFAAHGYIVILPNGLRFDDPGRIHPYFIAKLQAHVLLDAARAVYDFADYSLADELLARPGDTIFVMGYSSGGHAAFAAKDWASSYAPELPIKGIIGYGPTTNAETLLREDPIFSPYIVYAYQSFYGSDIIDVSDVFLPQWARTFEADVLNQCVDDIFEYYSHSQRDMYTAQFSALLRNNRLAQVHPLFAAKLAENDAGVSGNDGIAVLILQGTADTVVTPDSQRAFKDRLCEQGNRVTYVEYPAVSHREIRTTGLGDTLWWMQQVVKGKTTENHCKSTQ